MSFRKIEFLNLKIIDKGENSILVENDLSNVERIFYKEIKTTSIISTPSGSVAYFNGNVSELESGFYEVLYNSTYAAACRMIENSFYGRVKSKWYSDD